MTSELGPQPVIRTLVVDDYLPMQQAMSAILKQIRNVEVVAVTDNPIVALQVTRASTVDLVVTDLVMPEMNGLELSQNVKRQSPWTKVVLVSIVDDPILRAKLWQSDVDYFVRKADLASGLPAVISALFTSTRDCIPVSPEVDLD